MNVTRSLLLILVLCGVPRTTRGLQIPKKIVNVVTIDTLFAPDDRPTTRLIKEIDETRDKILAAVYYISDQKIVDALIRAHQRDVQVRIISDAQTSYACYSKVNQLAQAGIPVFIPRTKKKTSITKAAFSRQPLMHDKFAIVNGKVWTGSFNWTVGANTMNHENVVIISGDPATYTKFFNRFFEIEQACEPFTPLILRHIIVRLAPIFMPTRSGSVLDRFNFTQRFNKMSHVIWQ